MVDKWDLLFIELNLFFLRSTLEKLGDATMNAGKSADNLCLALFKICEQEPLQ